MAETAGAAGAVDQGALETMLRHWRWQSEEGKGGMDFYIRVRDTAQRTGFARAIAEVEQAGHAQAALLKLAAAFRQRAIGGEAPGDIPVPPYRPNPRAPEPDAAKLRAEQQIGYRLAMAACGSQLQEAAGGEM